MSLEETKARLLAVSKTPEGLLTQIDELYVQDIQLKEKQLEVALQELHNSGYIDLVELVKGVEKSSDKYDFFTILHVFENALSALNANVEDILHCLVHLSEQAGRDLAIGGIYGAFQSFCSLEADRSRVSIGVILNQSDLDAYSSFLSSSILAFHSDNLTEAIQAAKSLSVHENKAVRSQAYFSLGRLNLVEAQADVIWDLLSSNANSERDSNCCASLLRAILNFGEKFPAYWQPIEGLLITFVNSASPEVQYEISDIVAFQRVDLPERILHLLVHQLTKVSAEHKGIINNIDYLLVKLAENNSTPFAIQLLESILAVGVDFSSLSYFSRELLFKHQKLLSHIITKWFLTGESSLCKGIYDLLHDLTDNDIELKAEMSLLKDETSQVFVCHKAVGWLFTKPIAAASFILSIYESGSLSLRKELERLLYDPLLLSYPGDLERYFQACIEINNQHQICDRLLRELERHHESLAQINNLKELRAPLENVNAYWKNFDKSMQKAKDESPRPFFEQICTVQNLLYGNSSIYYIHLGHGEPVRQEMEMQSFSHSTEMPRLNVLDPENLDYMLRIYRCERIQE